jgi:hypothetical protein
MMISYNNGKVIKSYRHVNFKEYLNLNSTVTHLEKEIHTSSQNNLDSVEKQKFETYVTLKQRLSDLDNELMKVDIYPLKPHANNKKILQFIIQTPQVQHINQNALDRSQIFIDREHNTITFNMDYDSDVENSSYGYGKGAVNVIFDTITKTVPNIKKIKSPSSRLITKHQTPIQQSQCKTAHDYVTIQTSNSTSPSQQQTQQPKNNNP